MKSKFSLALSASIACSVFLFAGNVNANHAAVDPVAQNSKAHTQKDGEIIAILLVVNKNEIAAAKEALKKTTNPAVKQYAQMIEKEHTKNLQETLKTDKKIGVTPIAGKIAVTLKQDGKKELIAISVLKGNDFDKAYIKAMVKGHSDVLHMMDDNLLKNVSNPALKKLLLATRPHIQAHLQQAQAIQNELK